MVILKQTLNFTSSTNIFMQIEQTSMRFKQFQTYLL